MGHGRRDVPKVLEQRLGFFHAALYGIGVSESHDFVFSTLRALDRFCPTWKNVRKSMIGDACACRIARHNDSNGTAAGQRDNSGTAALAIEQQHSRQSSSTCTAACAQQHGSSMHSSAVLVLLGLCCCAALLLCMHVCVRTLCACFYERMCYGWHVSVQFSLQRRRYSLRSGFGSQSFCVGDT